MTKQVLDVGNCGSDHRVIRAVIERVFDASLTRTHAETDTLAALGERKFDLVLVNRLLDRDGSQGLDIIRKIKSHPDLSVVPVMMLTDYPEHQQRAVEAGAEPGFGKSELHSPETLDKLRRFLA